MGILRFLETQFIRIWRRIQEKRKGNEKSTGMKNGQGMMF